MFDLVGINFRNCGTSINPCHRRAATGDTFYVSNMPFERSSSAVVSRRRSISCDLATVNKQIAEFRSTIRVAWSSPTMCLTLATCRLSDLRKPPEAAKPPPSAEEPLSSAAEPPPSAASCRRSISCDLANVNKCKLRTFDRPLELRGHRRRDFDVGDVSYRRKMTVRVRDNCRCYWSWSMSPPSPFRNFAENPQFCTFFLPSILRNSISHFILYQHLPPKGTAMKNQKLTPAALGGKQFR